jgi:hypothetical protein
VRVGRISRHTARRPLFTPPPSTTDEISAVYHDAVAQPQQIQLPFCPGALALHLPLVPLPPVGIDDAAGIIIAVEEEEEEEEEEGGRVIASMNAAASWISRRGTAVRVSICGSEGSHSKRIYTKYVN